MNSNPLRAKQSATQKTTDKRFGNLNDFNRVVKMYIYFCYRELVTTLILNWRTNFYDAVKQNFGMETVQ